MTPSYAAWSGEPLVLGPAHISGGGARPGQRRLLLLEGFRGLSV